MQWAKIDIFKREKFSNDWQYVCSTNQSKTCKEARERFIKLNPQYDLGTIRAFFSDNL
jgi:hypothetical protein